MEKYFTEQEYNFLQEAQSASVELAKSSNYLSIWTAMKEKFKELPESKKTDAYIVSLAKAAEKEFLRGLNKKLHSFAKDILQ